jgi:hypothetical protein
MKQGSTVLVIDDNEDFRKLLAETITMWGYNAAVAVDGEQALSIIEHFSPNLVIVDLDMPNMDGWSSPGESKRSAQTFRLSWSRRLPSSIRPTKSTPLTRTHSCRNPYTWTNCLKSFNARDPFEPTFPTSFSSHSM